MNPIGFLYKISSYFEEFNTSTYCAWLGTFPVIVTIDPEIIKTVTSSTEFLNKAEILYNPIDNAIPKGIVTSEGNIAYNNKMCMEKIGKQRISLKLLNIIKLSEFWNSIFLIN